MVETGQTISFFVIETEVVKTTKHQFESTFVSFVKGGQAAGWTEVHVTLFYVKPNPNICLCCVWQFFYVVYDFLSILCMKVYLVCVWQLVYVVYEIFLLLFFVYILYYIKSDLNLFYILYNIFYIIKLKQCLSERVCVAIFIIKYFMKNIKIGGEILLWNIIQSKMNSFYIVHCMCSTWKSTKKHRGRKDSEMILL